MLLLLDEFNDIIYLSGSTITVLVRRIAQLQSSMFTVLFSYIFKHNITYVFDVDCSIELLAGGQSDST